MFFQRHNYLVQLYFRIPKMSLIVIYDNEKCQKDAFQKVTSVLPGFVALCTDKDIVL